MIELQEEDLVDVEWKVSDQMYWKMWDQVCRQVRSEVNRQVWMSSL
jgi:hypothetical protein